MTNQRERRVAVPDGEVHVVEAGTGPDVVLAHPGGLDLTVWDEVAAALAADHHVVRFDARSHGRSTTAMVDHHPARDLVAVLDALGIPRAHLVGCSMGGVTSLDTAVTAPDRVATLTLLGGALWPADYDGDEFVLGQHAAMAEAVEQRDGAAWVEAMTRLSVDGPDRSPGGVDPAVRARVAALAAAAVRNHATATGTQQWSALRDHLAEVGAPTLVLDAEFEPAGLHAAARLIAERVPDARLVRLSGTGHMAMLEAPDVIAGAVRDHVAAHPVG